jgi:hypothetical protein
MVERLLSEYGRWDVLVNNSAVAVTKPFPQITEAEFERGNDDGGNDSCYRCERAGRLCRDP